MIGRLADRLVDQYAADATHIVDPFCGSGAVIEAALDRHLRVSGVDLNPFAVLLSGVKLEGFAAEQATDLCRELIDKSCRCNGWLMKWNNADYWFTPATLRKLTEIREGARELRLWESPEGRAVLLALGLSIRLCSRADQRSPKPFVSKIAVSSRRGKHFDPYVIIPSLLTELGALYGRVRDNRDGVVFRRDMANPNLVMPDALRCSHVITSPPYANAQDYFRNFKLELYALEGLMDYEVDDVKANFVGTERAPNRGLLSDLGAEGRRDCLPGLGYLEKVDSGKAAILHRYLKDMETAFAHVRRLLMKGGTLVLVCGDNLIAGRRFETWAALNRILSLMGFRGFDGFDDRILNRALAPKRNGHRGLIKQEVVTAFRMEASSRASDRCPMNP